MRVPVIVALPAQAALQDSALSIHTFTPAGPSEELSGIPSRIDIDRSFAAVPVGSGERGMLESLESLSPQASQRFAVRGMIEVSSPEEIPFQQENGALVFADPLIEPLITCADPSLGTHNDVALSLDVSTLHSKGLDGEGVAVAILDTGINFTHLNAKLGFTPRIDAGNSWTPPGSSNRPFNYAVDHGTMCAFDALIAAPKATLLDYPILQGNAPGGSTMGRALSSALLGFSHLLAFWGVAFAPSGANRYKALVVNNSWGMYHPSWDFPADHPGRYADNPAHPFNVIVSTLANTNADIVFAAGNCGAECPDPRCRGKVTESISGANALPDVLTFAGCDISGARVGYSSQGPSISGMYLEKPDLTAYTHFKGSEAFGANSPDSGTSTACPVGAGCIAALRTGLDPKSTPPTALFDQLRTTARPVSGLPGWNTDYGYGIIDPVQTARTFGLI